ncbi:MAG: hypothetical protein ABJ013_04095 [Halioglobus sp.]
MVKLKAEHFTSSRRRQLWLALVMGVLALVIANPQGFLNLWLTPDQQGRLWFRLGEYDRASRAFEDPRWRGFSLYAGEEFATAERYFSQYQDAESLLARANALAHQRDYGSAKLAYEELASRYPDHPAPAVNLPVMDALIEATEQLPENEASESGESKNRPGDRPGSSEGDDEQRAVELEQYSADQLLQDPGLTDMWLRQIKRDPSEFLSTKFYLELEQSNGANP